MNPNKKTQRKIQKLKEKNLKDVFEHSPRLSYSRSTWIEARDRKQKLVLVGGLGSFGVGTMWVEEEERHKRYAGYEDAPEKRGTYLKINEDGWETLFNL